MNDPFARKKNPQLKAERGYTGESFVRNDGSEVLVGIDWAQRVKELYDRCNGRCEWVVDAGMEGAVIMVYTCGKEANDPHHVNPRSKGRDDRLSNLMALCRYHHDLLDKRKPKWSRQKEAV